MTQAEERVATDGESARDANETRRSEARKLITERRSLALASASIDSKIRINGRWANFADTNARNSFVKDNPYIGLALSGGGIRSATISLGLVESLAAQGRFYGFDMMSTVSGGGYFGSFLRALFVERAPDDGMEENKAIVTDRIACANATLLSLPDQQFFRGAPHSSAFVREGLSIKNPLWWLRENGRYLAPGGMSDYGYALAYIVRNWLTLQICLLAALMLGFASLQFGMVGLVQGVRAVAPTLVDKYFSVIRAFGLMSPLTPLVTFLAIAWVGLAAGYWLTLSFHFGKSQPKVATGWGWTRSFVAGAFLMFLAWAITKNRENLPTDVVVLSWEVSLVVGIVFAVATFLVPLWQVIQYLVRRYLKIPHSWLHRSSTALPDPVKFRRWQTHILSGCGAIQIGFFCLLLIDETALHMRLALRSKSLSELLSAGLGSGILTTVSAFLVTKLPGWIGVESGGWRAVLVRYANQGAFFAAFVILTAVAFYADLLVIKLLWKGDAWCDLENGSWCQLHNIACTRIGHLDWSTFFLVHGLIALFAGFLWWSVNFPNLLSLTPFYGSRLSRAYLGGSNFARLNVADPSEVTNSLVGDDLGLKEYMNAKTPAPLHLINVTRNRTIGEKVARSKIDTASDDPLIRETSLVH